MRATNQKHRRLLAETADAERVLDVGGAHVPLNTATHTHSMHYLIAIGVRCCSATSRNGFPRRTGCSLTSRRRHGYARSFMTAAGYWRRAQIRGRLGPSPLVQFEGDTVTFLAKTLMAVPSRKFFITRAELGRSLTGAERDRSFLAGSLHGARVAAAQARRDRDGACPFQEGDAAQAPQPGTRPSEQGRIQSEAAPGPRGVGA
jgi:hypothetical protein